MLHLWRLWPPCTRGGVQGTAVYHGPCDVYNKSQRELCTLYNLYVGCRMRARRKRDGATSDPAEQAAVRAAGYGLRLDR